MYTPILASDCDNLYIFVYMLDRIRHVVERNHVTEVTMMCKKFKICIAVINTKCKGAI